METSTPFFCRGAANKNVFLLSGTYNSEALLNLDISFKVSGATSKRHVRARLVVSSWNELLAGVVVKASSCDRGVQEAFRPHVW